MHDAASRPLIDRSGVESICYSKIYISSLPKDLQTLRHSEIHTLKSGLRIRIVSDWIQIISSSDSINDKKYYVGQNPHYAFEPGPYILYKNLYFFIYYVICSERYNTGYFVD